MKRTVPHQHRILAERSWARGGPSPGEDVSRGRLGCPTCPRVDAAGGPRADTRPPPIQQPPSSQRSESRPLNSAARACRRPRQGRRGHPRRRKRLPAEGQPERPRKTRSAGAKHRRRAAPHPATPSAGPTKKVSRNSHKNKQRPCRATAGRAATRTATTSTTRAGNTIEAPPRARPLLKY